MTLHIEGVYIRWVDEKGKCRRMERMPDLDLPIPESEPEPKECLP